MTALSPSTRSLLDPVLAGRGPFTSVYLNTPSALADARSRHRGRVEAVGRELHALGVTAPETILDALGEHPTGESRAVIASGGQVVLAVSLPIALTPDSVVRTSGLPHLLPLLDVLAQQLPHLVVLADRTGADIAVHTAGIGKVEEPEDTEQVFGTALDIRKSAPGGWSQRRYQQRAENGWEENAGVMAARVGELADAIGAARVVAAGDERALHLIFDRLPAHLRSRWTVVPGGRGKGSAEAVPGHVREVMTLEAARRHGEVLAEYAEELGQDDRAVAGVAATMRALALRQVGALLLSDVLDPARRAYVGPDPSMIATSADEVRALGVSDPVEVALIDAAVWSAVSSGATVRSVRSEHLQAPPNGIGALLRYQR